MILFSRGAAFFGAGFPVGGVVGIGQGIDDLEGVALAGGRAWPRGLVVVLERHQRLAKRIFEHQLFAAPG